MHFPSRFFLSITLLTVLLAIGCSEGSDNPVKIVKGNWKVAGKVSFPADASATATASLRHSADYSTMRAHLIQGNNTEIKESVSLAAVDGAFAFANVPDNQNLKIRIVSNSGKSLAAAPVDSLNSDMTSIQINSRSTVLAALVSLSNLSISAEKLNESYNEATIDLMPQINLIENWWGGRYTSLETDSEKILLSYFGNAQLQSIIQTANTASESETIIDQPGSDLVFYADSGWRTGFGTTNPMAGISENGQVYLYHNRDQSQPEPGQKLAVSAEGLVFSTFYSQPFSHQYHPKYVLMPDGVTRRTYFPDILFSGEVISQSFISDGQPVRDDGVRFSATSNDNGTIGIVDVFPDNRGGMVMLYIGDKTGANDIRRAYSPPGDNGMNFSFTNNNVLGDAYLAQASEKNVDQFSLLLPDGRRRLFTMSHAGSRINSFISGDHGTTFSQEIGLRLTPEVFSEFKVYSLHDPSVVILPDGRHRMYVCARVDYNKSAPEGASDRYTYVIVSATTKPAF